MGARDDDAGTAAKTGIQEMSFTCPRCGAVSHHPKDKEHGYCARCHDFTGRDWQMEAERANRLLDASQH
jgi:transcription elongation factor Elf1